ncbi:MAG TPA: hemerythrin domain-containing protein [Methyloceanibacter sp.]|nr:hemerythrin domain-containing protein [Methyloceanibacter sp.]
MPKTRSTSRGRSKARKAGAKTRRSATQGQDAIALLRADHKAVSDQFDDYDRRKDRLSDDRKLEMVRDICRALKVHTQIEEEIFYPAARGSIPKTGELLDEANVEHASAKDLIRQLEEARPDDDLYDAKVKVLGEYVKHHVKEEQNELFQMVKKSRLDTRELGEELKRRKEELMGAV